MSIFSLPEFAPYQRQWNARQEILHLRESYYSGDVFQPAQLRQQIGNALFPRLYKNIKPLFLPISRAVDVDVGLVPGEWRLVEDIIPTHQDAVNQIFTWSHWQTDGVLYVSNGSKYGLSGLKMIFDSDTREVALRPISPTRFIIPNPNLAIQIEMFADGDTDFEYAEVITPDAIRTYKDGQLFDYGMGHTRINPVGFIPFIETQHIRENNPHGTPTFEKVIPILEQVNTAASHLADIIRRHGEPQWAGFGVSDDRDMYKSGESFWFIPDSDSRVEALVPQVDIGGMMQFIEAIDREVKAGLPELAFDELKQGQIATQTIELQLAELVIKINRIRPNYDNGLRTGMRMCGLALGQLGRSDLANVLLDDALHFDSHRPVLPVDEKARLETEMLRLQLEQMEGTRINEGVIA